jgi:hypothetical protein
MPSQLDGLLTTLNNTNIQRTDPRLFQVIQQLIKTVKELETKVNNP